MEEHEILAKARVRASEFKLTYECPIPSSPYEAPPFMCLLRERSQLLDWNYVGQVLKEFTSYIASDAFKVP